MPKVGGEKFDVDFTLFSLIKLFYFVKESKYDLVPKVGEEEIPTPLKKVVYPTNIIFEFSPSIQMKLGERVCGVY